MPSNASLGFVRKDLLETDRLQRIIARLVATSPAGIKLLLIGGFRYRLLDGSHRLSVDIDYHWEGNLDDKLAEILSLCRRVILPQVHRELGYEGSAYPRTGPDADSPLARFIDLRFWKAGFSTEIPIEITQITCLDPPTIRTAEGTVHATPSDADMIESKIVAVYNRVFLQHRDLLDLFLYGEKLRPDSHLRLKRKLRGLNLQPSAITERLKDLAENSLYHAKAIQKVIDEQTEAPVAEQLNAGGGGKTVLKSVLELLKRTSQP